jgi:hypothetical protein
MSVHQPNHLVAVLEVLKLSSLLCSIWLTERARRLLTAPAQQPTPTRAHAFTARRSGHCTQGAGVLQP